MDMTTIFTQMGTLVFIMVVGFFCAKIGLAGPAFTGSASSVVINVLLVFTILYSVMDIEMELSLGEIGLYMLYFTLLLLIMAAVAFAAMKLLKIKLPESGISMFAITFPNTVFMAFPVINAVFGPEGVFIASLSNIPFNLLNYTLGVAQIRGGLAGMSVRKAMGPPLVASVLAVALFLSGIEVPGPVKETFGTLSGATVPMSMLIVGVSLGSLPLKKALLNWRAYVVAAFRLLFSPLMTYAVLRLLGVNELMLGTSVILFSAPPAMVLTLITIQCGSDEAYASECVFIGTVLSALTMPATIWLLLM